MDIKKRPDSFDITDEEAKLLIDASGDFANKGTTDIKCPRCRGELTCEALGNSGVVKCKNEHCLKITFRGL